MKMLFSIAGVLVLLSVSSVLAGEADFPQLKGPYLGQEPPGATPQVFAPGVVSTEAHEFSCSFTSDGREFYFSRRHPEFGFPVVMMTVMRDGAWTEPEVAPFVENDFSFEPRVTPDDQRLYFSSGKPIPGQPGPPMNVLYVEREGDGWGAAQDPGPPFNPAQTMLISVAASGTIYTTDISGGPGSECISVVHRVEGEYQALEKMGAPFAGESQCMYPCVAPDESYLIVTAKRPEDEIKSVLLVSFRQPDGSWGEPSPIDLGADAALPFVSRDGKYLFFTAGERGKSDISWVSARVIEDLRP